MANNAQDDKADHDQDRPALPGTHHQMQPIEGATVDLGRQTRCGFGEAIYGEGKSAELIAKIIDTQISQGQESLVTRITPQVLEQLCERFPHARGHSLARTLRVANGPLQAARRPIPDETHVAVVTAGSTDAGIAAEAIETLAWMGIAVETFDDIGVAGPQRLLAAVPRLRQAAALVVIAGMEGALPSVIAGHVAAPIFAVPTSVGYGAHLAGVAALLGMLNSCAAGVAVVNIDAGFKGGYMAGMVVTQPRA